MKQTLNSTEHQEPKFDVKWFFLNVLIGIAMLFIATFVENILLHAVPLIFKIEFDVILDLPGYVNLGLLAVIWLLLLWPFAIWRKYTGQSPLNRLALALSCALFVIIQLMIFVIYG